MKPQTLVIKLSNEEFEALRNQAQGELRHPRDEARIIIRRVLFGEPFNANTGAVTAKPHAGVAAA
jgi:hypothetical protein